MMRRRTVLGLTSVLLWGLLNGGFAHANGPGGLVLGVKNLSRAQPGLTRVTDTLLQVPASQWVNLAPAEVSALLLETDPGLPGDTGVVDLLTRAARGKTDRRVLLSAPAGPALNSAGTVARIH